MSEEGRCGKFRKLCCSSCPVIGLEIPLMLDLQGLIIIALIVAILYVYYSMKQGQDETEKQLAKLIESQAQLLKAINRLEVRAGVSPSSTALTSAGGWELFQFGMDAVSKLAKTGNEVYRAANERERYLQAYDRRVEMQ